MSRRVIHAGFGQDVSPCGAHGPKDLVAIPGGGSYFPTEPGKVTCKKCLKAMGAK